MYYILNSQQTYNKTPEISYAPGVTMQFKRGYFIFDTDHTTENYYESDGYLQISGLKHKIYEKIPNKIKAEAYFLHHKIIELKNNGFDFFMPSSFKQYTDRFDQINIDHPEYLI